MKSPEFDYVKPPSLDQALALLSQHGDDARLLAGGQSLLASLNMRLSEPALLIDISGIDALRGIKLENDVLRIGALTTHTEIESSALVAKHAPLLTKAAPEIAHRAIRNSGTWGGSLAYADPAAEWPACFLALGGTAIVRGPKGERRVAADDFFLNLYTTAIEPDEILVACEVPVAKADSWYAFSELARRHGDYAIVGMAISATKSGQKLSQARIALMGVDATPKRATETENFLAGKTLDAATLAQAVKTIRGELDPTADLTNSAETKRHLAGVLLERLLKTATA